MLIIGKTVVAAAGTPGPLLGDGVKTTCTILLPSSTSGVDLFNPRGPDGTPVSVLNNAVRQSFQVAHFQLYGLDGNTGDAFWGGADTTAADMIRLAAGQASPTFGISHLNIFDLMDVDVDAAVNGEGVLFWVELA